MFGKREEAAEVGVWLNFGGPFRVVKGGVPTGTPAPLGSVTPPAMPDTLSWARKTAGAQNRDTTRNVTNIDESRFKVRFIVRFLAELTVAMDWGPGQTQLDTFFRSRYLHV